MGGLCEEDSDCTSKYQYVEGTACIDGTCQCRDSSEVICCEGGTLPDCYRECRPCSECAPGTVTSGSCPDIDIVWLYAGPEELAPDCPDGKPPLYEGWANLDAPPCEPCSCGPALCAPPDGLSLHSTDGCDAQPAATFTPAAVTAGVCATAAPVTGEFNAIMHDVTTLAPCEASGPPDPPPATWGLYGRVCEPDTASTLFVECIEAEACPPDFPTQRTFHRSIEDTRTCGACACESPEGGACDAYVTVYEGPSCTQPIQATSVDMTPGPCIAIAMTKNTVQGMLVEWQQTVAGTCKPIPRTTAGQATPAEPRSFCCRD
jgi:hypothetical protein